MNNKVLFVVLTLVAILMGATIVCFGQATAVIRGLSLTLKVP